MRPKLGRILLLVVAACTLTVGVIGATPAGAKKKSCKQYKEQKGCKLKIGTTYAGGTNSPISTSVGVNAYKSTFTIQIRGGLTCANSGQKRVIFRARFAFPGRLKVGKSFAFSGLERPGGSVKLSGKLKISSRKKAKLTATYNDSASNDRVSPCTADLGRKLKRVKI